jgi:hypothetical protein
VVAAYRQPSHWKFGFVGGVGGDYDWKIFVGFAETTSHF